MMCNTGAGETQGETLSEMFVGTIKSFSSRRGFGFLSCEETSQLYGRDVYLSKDEAMTLADAPAVGQTTSDPEATSTNEKSKPPVQEGDCLSFCVKLSTEGFPQAVQVRRVRRLRGMVSQPPSSTSCGVVVITGDGAQGDAISPNSDCTLEQLLGTTVRLPLSTCGQLQVMPDDEISFCCFNRTDLQGHLLEAYRVDLIKTSRIEGSVLGCFSLKLPVLQTKSDSDGEDGASTAASTEDFAEVELQGYALTPHEIFLSDMPPDLCKSDVMRLFAKIGGQAATVTNASCSDVPGLTCITFNTTEQVAKFLSQSTHTVSENGITQLAKVGPCFHRRCGSSCSFCACQASRSPAVNETIMGNVDQSPPAEPEQMQQTAPPTCVPCVALPASSDLCQHSHLQYAAPVSGNTAIAMNTTGSLPDWLCVHGSILTAAEVPEIKGEVGEMGWNIHIQWPTVIHASAYVVDILEQQTGFSQRFVRSAAPDIVPALTDLRIDGLQLGTYGACVRCVAPCGCESVCSPWAVLPPSCGMPPSAPTVHMQPPPSAPAPIAILTPDLCPPPIAPPSLPVTSSVPMEHLRTLEDVTDVNANCADEGLILD